MCSELPIERYHALSDATMDTMLDNLENLLDDLGKSEYEVEYSVRLLAAHCYFVSCMISERCIDTGPGGTRNVCHQ